MSNANAEEAPMGTGAIVGVARNVQPGAWPLNALRHPEVGTTSGWYIWAGEELLEDPDFFEPVHAHHLADRCPDLIRFLELPPGWRVLLAPGHEDVWFDATLLEAD